LSLHVSPEWQVGTQVYKNAYDAVGILPPPFMKKLVPDKIGRVLLTDDQKLMLRESARRRVTFVRGPPGLAFLINISRCALASTRGNMPVFNETHNRLRDRTS
jgi:hypothetical protein